MLIFHAKFIQLYGDYNARQTVNGLVLKLNFIWWSLNKILLLNKPYRKQNTIVPIRKEAIMK